MSEQELAVKAKFIDFASTTFPEVNPIDFMVADLKGSQQIRLQTYRYPCPEGIARKGIVQWIHGFNDYSGRYAFAAKHLAERGYEVVSMDQRGFGFSQGTRGLIMSPEQARDDILLFTEKVNEKFGGKDVPHFTIGHSLGGALQIYAACEQPDLFAGMTLITPFISMAAKQQEQFDSLKPLAKLLGYCAPSYQLSTKEANPPKWTEHWRQDPNAIIDKTCVQSVL